MMFPTVSGLFESKSTAISVPHPTLVHPPIRMAGPPELFREPRFESAV